MFAKWCFALGNLPIEKILQGKEGRCLVGLIHLQAEQINSQAGVNKVTGLSEPGQ